jgi:heat shock protein 4
LYEDGEDATKAVYIAKMDEIRAMAGPIAQRYFDKVETDRAALQAKLDAEAAAKRAADEEAKKSQEPAKDEVMTDADPQPETEEK